jgi:hypothetical protein
MALSATPDRPTRTRQSDALSRDELQRLTLYKWRYSMEAYGFSDYEVEQLVFLTWLHATGRVRG